MESHELVRVLGDSLGHSVVWAITIVIVTALVMRKVRS